MIRIVKVIVKVIVGRSVEEEVETLEPALNLSRKARRFWPCGM